MLESPFIDRTRELQTLLALAQDERDGALVLFLRAATGVGKSSVVDQLILQATNLKSVRTPMLARLGGERLDYLNHIVRYIDDFAARTRRAPRFQVFLSRAGSAAVAAETASRVLGRAASWVPLGTAAAPMVQKVFHAEEYSGQAIMFRERSLDVAATSSYVADFMKDPLALLAVENIQQIDDRSLLVLLNVLEQVRSGFWIFEYTQGTTGHQLDALAARFRSAGATTKTMDLGPLPWEELCRSLDVQTHSAEPILRQHYSKSNGNLRDFLDAKRLAREDASTLLRDSASTATTQVLERLSNDLAQLVALLAMHDGRSDVETLRHATTKIRQRMAFAERFDFDKELERLVQEKILLRREQTVQFDHDSVLRTALELEAHERLRRIAAVAWLTTYREMRQRGDIFISPAAIASAILFYSFFLEDDAELFTTLRQLTRSSLEALAPTRLVQYIQTLYSRIRTSGSGNGARMHDLTREIVATLYRIGAFDAAEKLLAMLQPTTDVARFYRIALAIELDRPQEALQGSEQVLRDYRRQREHPMPLAARLVKLAALRMTNRPDDCATSYRKYKSSGVFEASPLKPHFRILAGMALPSQDAIPMVQEGVSLFASDGHEDEANCGRITLSQCLGDLGRLEEAHNVLEAVQATNLAEREQYSVWNNQAALRLYDRTADEGTLSLLRNAALLPVDRFSRLIVLTNILIAHGLRGAQDDGLEAADQVHKILESGEPEEHEIRRIAAFNLSFFYNRFSMKSEASNMVRLTRSIPSEINQPLWDHRFGSHLTALPDAYKFRASFDYYPPMFAYWLLDVADYLER